MGVEQEERDMWQPFFLTIEVAFLSTMLSFVAGVLLAYFVWCRQHGKAIFDAVLALPMVLPPTAVGFFLLLFFWKTEYNRRIFNRAWHSRRLYL